MSVDPAEIVARFAPEPGTTYLDSATYGLPPKATLDAVSRCLDGWRGGTARWVEDWDREAEVCRELCARLLHAQPREVSLMPAVSVASGIVATAVPRGGEVLVASGDFTSVLYPFLAAAERGLLRVREAPLEQLADAVSADTCMVAVSLVQSADGRVADLEAIRAAASRIGRHGHGARLYVDASQALGTYPVEVSAMGIDYLSCGAYKWLCCPRGVAFLYVREELWDEPMSIAASWRGGDDPYGRFYGTPLALAPDAARFDVSLAWHAWVGARHSLETLCELDDAVRFEMAMAPARRLAERLGLPEPAAPILSVPVREGADVGAALEEARIKVSVRAGRLRVAPHFYNSLADADRAADVLAPFTLPAL